MNDYLIEVMRTIEEINEEMIQDLERNRMPFNSYLLYLQLQRGFITQWGPNFKERFSDLFSAEERDRSGVKANGDYFSKAYSKLNFYLLKEAPEIIQDVKNREQKAR